MPVKMVVMIDESQVVVEDEAEEYEDEDDSHEMVNLPKKEVTAVMYVRGSGEPVSEDVMDTKDF